MIVLISSAILPRLLSRTASSVVLSLVLAGSANAQVAGTPGPALPVPDQTGVQQNLPLNPNLPTIFIVGDSTARNKADLGWGDHFAHYFDLTKVNVANRAIAGRSARSYMNEGAWDKVLAELKAGDYVLLQWGHNDGGGTITPDFKGRGEGKGIGEEAVDIPIATPFAIGPLAGKTTETIHTYGWYYRKYIADIRAKGAHPVLLTVTVRNIWPKGADGQPHMERDMGYRDYAMQIAAAEKVPLIDMATVAADKFEMLGVQTTALLFPIDHTHTSAVGAEMNAASVVTALKNAKSPLVDYLAPTVGPTR
ncbi:MAG: rhamnogalacturonan acetylesterase [Acidobacteriota bacterium]|nr:rhamnogalacturonan acetylesterase [Acidobacteriota bacterium]